MNFKDLFKQYAQAASTAGESLGNLAAFAMENGASFIPWASSRGGFLKTPEGATVRITYTQNLTDELKAGKLNLSEIGNCELRQFEVPEKDANGHETGSKTTVLFATLPAGYSGEIKAADMVKAAKANPIHNKTYKFEGNKLVDAA